MGVFFAYAHSEGDAYGHNLGIPDNFARKPELDGASVGAYWTRMAPNGAYVDAVAMATHYDSSCKSTSRRAGAEVRFAMDSDALGDRQAELQDKGRRWHRPAMA